MDVMKKMKKTTTTGRNKIEIKEIDKDSNKQVTISKRHNGLFKKASELCVLCGAQIAIILFSPTGKPFCFGQPSVEAVLYHYVTTEDHCEEPVRAAPAVASEIGTLVSYEELNKQHEEAIRTLEMEKQQLEEIKNVDKENWWDEPIDEMDLDPLEQYVLAMHEFRRKVANKVDRLTMAPTEQFVASCYGQSSLGGLPYGVGSSSGGYAN